MLVKKHKIKKSFSRKTEKNFFSLPENIKLARLLLLPPSHGPGRAAQRGPRRAELRREQNKRKKTTHIKVFASTSPSIDSLVASFEKKFFLQSKTTFLKNTNKRFFRAKIQRRFLSLLVCLKLSYNILVCLFDLREV